MNNRFGIEKEELDKFTIFEKSGDYWIKSKQSETDLEFETQGIRFIRKTGIGLKPTTYGLQIIEPYIKKNVFDASKEQFLKLLSREMVDEHTETTGYIAIKFRGRVIGCGLYKSNCISSKIPKGRSKELRKIIKET